MAIDTTSLRSRRALLAGSLGGLAALAAQALGRPAPLQATHGDVHLGRSNTTTGVTSITNTTAGGTAFQGTASGVGTAVIGGSNSGVGVRDVSEFGTGVFGGSSSGSGQGIYGKSVLGRGGRFMGKKAQIQLVPSTAATHPLGGSVGELFVDASQRLWFCKGRMNWVRLA